MISWLKRETGSLEGPDLLACLVEIAQVYDTSVGDAKMANEAWSAVLSVSPDDPQALRRLVELTKEQKDFRSYVSYGERLLRQLDEQEQQVLLLELGELRRQ